MSPWRMLGGYNGRGGGPLPALAIIACLTLLPRLATTYKSEVSGCVFPSRWAGHWFQSGVLQQITIEGDRLSTKGKCLSSEGDKFVLVDDRDCHKCVVIHEKHINVLQYKETFCHPKEKLPHICALITGDALLYSMFRENSSPVTCPLKGPFSFTYNRGHGECKSPVSSIESCTEESRLLLNYQACPDVYGSESIVEELECLATWKEGSLRYLVGKIHHNHATSNEDRYRCFVYEKMNGIGHTAVKEGEIEYKVAQSGDATCNGLFSAMEGSRTMSLKRVPMTWKCKFPPWLTFPGHWHTLDYSSTYSFHQKNATLRITNQTGADVKVHCAHTKAASPSGNSIALVAHWQHHCVGRFVCLAFHRRGTHVVELQMGKPAIKAEEACSTARFDPTTTPFVTLVTNNPENKACPYSGKFTINGLKILQRNARSLIIEDNRKLSHHKHSHRKHKYIDSNGNEEEISNAQWQKIKYQKFLEKIFAKEAHKKELKLARKKLLLLNKTLTNNTLAMNKTIEELDNISFDNITDIISNRTKRSTKSNTESNTCVNSEYTMLDIGCNSEENMEFHSSCDNKDFITSYSCHGGWTENGTSFLITTPLTRDSIGAKRYCFIYKETRDQIVHFTRSSVGCERNIKPGVDGSLVFNATNSGECLVTASGSSPLRNKFSDCLVVNLTIMFVTYCFTLR